ncbi:MFS transporter [Sphaerisporangium fuscum]|uniref:MFS transporter n=1 Tax=Sphaerisporangium fuscum TaxID=2835868 RepID=UPI001BDDA952|nr:MFS transporter [Sphaerisporangium fuscum]
MPDIRPARPPDLKADDTHAAPRPELRRALVALCATEITSWGVLYYSFPVALDEVTRDTGWSTAAAMSAFSAGLVTSAVASTPVGRMLDRRGPRTVMTIGSILGTAGLVAVATAPGLPWFVAAWVLTGLAQSMLLYPPAFAAITTWYGPDRIRPLTTLSLAGGLASTVYAPLTALLVTHLGWRSAYLALAVLLAAVTLPLHAFCLTPPWPARPARSRVRDVAHIREVASSPPFLLLAAALGLGALGLYAATTNLVPLLVARGTDTTTAAVALGLCGVGQLLGRLGYPWLTRRTGPRGRAAAVLAAGAGAVAALAAIDDPFPLLIAVVVAAGAVRGVYTLLQATAVSDRWGVRHFATLNALATAPAGLATALAPAAGALLAARLGYPAAFWLLAVVTLAGAALALRRQGGHAGEGDRRDERR